MALVFRIKFKYVSFLEIKCVGGVCMPVEVCLEMYTEKSVVLPYFSGYVSRDLLLHFLPDGVSREN